jgi:hypothetical protein
MRSLMEIFQDDRKFYPNKYIWLFVAGLKTYSYTHSLYWVKHWYWNKSTLKEMS